MEHIRIDMEWIKFGCTEMATPILVKVAYVENAIEVIQTIQTSEWKPFWDEQNNTIRERE